MKHAHGGNLRALAQAAGRSEDDILDFSANINPLGPPEWLRPIISANVSRLIHYPDSACAALIEAAASRYGVDSDEVLAGNGSTELLYLLPRTLNAKRALIPTPAYIDYAKAANLAGLEVTKIALREDAGFALDLDKLESQLREHDVVFLGQPNNPTGLTCPVKALRALAIRHPAVAFIVDEAFIDFATDIESMTRQRPANVIVLLSLTKIFAVPGLRLGCAIADREIVGRAREIQPPWSVNTIAQAVGIAGLQDRQYIERTKAFVSDQRQKLTTALQSFGCLTVYPGQANFLLIRIDQSESQDQNQIGASELARLALRDGIAIRVCDNFDGLDDRFFRVAVRTDTENQQLVAALQKALGLSRDNNAVAQIGGP
ncbi:MAG: threonine-phosphate decarboxylase CobD, partial [Planctomycetota bacterium]